MGKAFYIEINAGIATVTFDLPGEKVNILTVKVMDELERVIEGLEAEAGLEGVILISGKDGTFIAGADISEIERITEPGEGTRLSEKGQAVFSRLEALPVPVVAAINGACLGGGLELALACTWRIASDSPGTFLGQPETMLGIIPGFGGTQRLPRVVGLAEAVRMITTGARVFPRRARKTGLVDEVVVKEHLTEAALRRLRGHAADKKGNEIPKRKGGGLAGFLLESNPLGRRIIFKKARQAIREKAGDNYPAPFAAVDAIERGIKHGPEEGYQEEAYLLGKMAETDVSKSLIRIFRLRERFTRVEGSLAAGVRGVGVLGAGVMGGGIAGLAAEKGFHVRLVDLSEKALGGSLKQIYSQTAKKRKKGLYSISGEEWVRSRVSYDSKLRGLGGMQVIVEAVAERMDVKKAVLEELGESLSADAVIVSNTSSLSISEMAEALPAPERFAGMHFFNPVDRMELVEVIRGRETSDETVALVAGLTRRLGKVPVVAGDRPGFLVNRILFSYLNEAVRLLESGISVERVDSVMTGFGMPMGAFILLDVVGLDIASHAGANLYQGYGERMKPSALITLLKDRERLGKKSGRGFYKYDASGNRKKDAELARILKPHIEKGMDKDIEDQDLVDRLILPMVNEAALVLEERVAEDPGAIDLAMTLGAGFPPYTGGLCRYADSRGLDEVVRILDELTASQGDRFRPCGLLRDLAASGRGFFDDYGRRPDRVGD